MYLPTKPITSSVRDIIINHKITLGRYTNISGSESITSKINNNILYADKCVLHLIDLTHITKHIYLDIDSDSLFVEDLDSDDEININITSSHKLKKDISNSNKISLQQHLQLIIDYIIDQHSDLWHMMKRGDLIEDISMTQFNDQLDCLDDFSPTKGLYIVDKIDNDNNKKCLTGSDIIRNGLTIKYLDKMYKSNIQNNIINNIFIRYAPSITMYTITDFPIGYFDNIIINNYMCSGPTDKSRTSWGFDNCLISLDVNRLYLNKLIKNDVHHVVKYRYNNQLIDYLYVIITFNNLRYMIISEYSSELMRYNMKNEIIYFINKFKSVHHMNTYNKTKDSLINEIAASENILINNVLCI